MQEIIILRLKRVLKVRGDRSRSSHYSDIKNGLWTKPVKIGPRASGCPKHECDILNQARIAGKSEQEIRDLVLQLHAERTGGAV